MAEKDKKVEEIEVINSEDVYVTSHKVKKEFLLDKIYKVGSSIELPEGKIKDSLKSNKFI